MKVEENFSPRAQLRYLTRHFFGRFFDSDVIAAPHTEMHLLFIQILALLIFPGFLKTALSITKYSFLAWYPITYRDQAILIDAHFFLCISMILTGFITVFEWDALFPDSKDFHNLTPLPIKPKTIFFAKVIALSLFVVLCHIAINGIPTLLFPGEVLAASFKKGSAGFMIPPGELFRYNFSHAVSLFLSTLFVFSSLIAVRAVFLLIFPAKMLRIVSRCTQLVVMLILLCALFSGAKANALITEESALIYLLPPFWFLGVYEVLIGHHTLVFSTLSKMAYTAVSVSCFVSILSYTISYRSSMQKGFQSAGIASYPVTGIRKSWTRILHKTILKNSIERANFHFIAHAIFRRQEPMLYWGSFVAVGIGLIYWDLYAIISGDIVDSQQHLKMLLSFPLLLSFFILVGLRFAFSVPVDLNANWIFRIMDKQRLEKSYGGAHKFMLSAINIPLLIIFVPCYLMIWNPLMVFYHIAYVSILSLILIELLLFRFIKLPFTCSYLPGKANVILLWPLYAVSCYFYSYGMTTLELWVLEDIKRCIGFVVISGIVFFGLSRNRSLFLKRIGAIRFEEKLADQRNILSIEG
jgi:hypothetical protein